MDKKIVELTKKLNKENRTILLKMERYMETRNINEAICEDILLDIAGMATECQERGESFSESIGGDAEHFCRELVKSAPRQTFPEGLFGFLSWLSIFFFLLFPVLFGIEKAFPACTPAHINGLDYVVPLSFLLKYNFLLFIMLLGWYLLKVYTYKPMKYKFGAYIGVIMLFFIFSDTVLHHFTGDSVVTIHLVIWLVSCAVLTALFVLSKRLVTLTVAYKKRKTSGKKNKDFKSTDRKKTEASNGA